MKYFLECNKWLEVDVKGLPANGARYGHTATVYKRYQHHLRNHKLILQDIILNFVMK